MAKNEMTFIARISDSKVVGDAQKIAKETTTVLSKAIEFEPKVKDAGLKHLRIQAQKDAKDVNALLSKIETKASTMVPVAGYQKLLDKQALVNNKLAEEEKERKRITDELTHQRQLLNNNVAKQNEARAATNRISIAGLDKELAKANERIAQAKRDAGGALGLVKAYEKRAEKNGKPLYTEQYDLSKVTEELKRLPVLTSNVQTKTDNLREAYEKLGYSIDRTSSADNTSALISRTEDANDSAQKLNDTVGETADALIKAESALEGFSTGFEKAEEASSSLVTRAEDIGKDTLNSDELKEVAAEAKETADNLQAVQTLSTIKIDFDANPLRMGRSELAKYIVSLKQYISSMDKIGVSEDKQKEYERATKLLTKAQNQMQRLNAEVKSTPPLNLKADVAKMNIADLMRYMQQLKSLINEIERQGMPTARNMEYQQASEQLIRAQRAARDYKKNLDAVAVSSDRTRNSVSSFRKVLSTLKGVGANALNNVRKGFNSLQRTINNVKSAFNKLQRQMQRGFKHNLTNLVKYVFGFRSLFFLVRRVRKYIKEGMENLAHYNDKVSKGVKSHNLFNDSMNELRASLNYLKNAWAAAFSPIIIYVMPALTAMIDKLAVAGNYIAYLTATLTGQATAYNALKTAVDDYADSLDKSGNSAKKNANNQDKLNEQLAEYDKLLVIAQKNDNDNGGNNGNGTGDDSAVNYQDMFTTIKTDAGDIASQLKDAIEKQDWTTFGSLIGQKIKDGIDSIDWTSIKKKFGEAGKKIGEFIKGLFNTENLADSIGKSAGEFLNAVNIFIVQLTNQTQDIDFGGGLANAIGAFINTTNWDLIEQNIKNVVRQFKENVKSAIENIPWKNIQFTLEGLSSAISSAITSALSDEVFMTDVGKGIAETVNTITSVLKGIFEGAKGKNVGNGLATALNATISTIKFDEVAKTISSGLVWALTNAADFLDTVDYTGFANAIKTFLENIDWKEVFSALAKMAVSSADAIINIFSSIGEGVSDGLMSITPEDLEDAVKHILEQLKPDKVAENLGKIIVAIIKSVLATANVVAALVVAIIDVLGTAFGDALWQAQEDATAFMDGIIKKLTDEGKEINFENIGEEIINGLLAGMFNIMDDINNWLVKYVFGPIADAFIQWFQIGSPSKKAEYWGEMVVEGFKNGLSGIWDSIKGIFTTLMTNITNVLFGEEQTLKAGNKVWKERVGGIFGFITNKGGIVDKVKEAFDNIKKYIVGEDGKGGIVKTMKDAFSDPLGSIKTSLFDEKNGLMKYFTGDNSIVKKIKHKLGLDDDTIGIVGALKKAFTSPLASIKTALFSENTGLMQYFSGNNSIIKKIKDKLNDSGIFDAFKKAFNFNAIFEQRTVSSKLSDSQKTLWEKLFGYKVGSKHINGLLDDLKDKFVSIWTGIKTGIKSPIRAILEMIENVINAGIDGINWLLKKAGSVTIAGKPILPSNWTNPLPDFTIDYKAIGLAQGAVIPPNKEFLAVLGDQKQGVNIETPLATMIDAFKTALAEGGGNTNHAPIVLQLEGRTVAQVVWNEEDKKYKQTGFGLAY